MEVIARKHDKNLVKNALDLQVLQIDQIIEKASVHKHKIGLLRLQILVEKSLQALHQIVDVLHVFGIVQELGLAEELLEEKLVKKQSENHRHMSSYTAPSEVLK